MKEYKALVLFNEHADMTFYCKSCGAVGIWQGWCQDSLRADSKILLNKSCTHHSLSLTNIPRNAAKGNNAILTSPFLPYPRCFSPSLTHSIHHLFQRKQPPLSNQTSPQSPAPCLQKLTFKATFSFTEAFPPRMAGFVPLAALGADSKKPSH